LRHRGTEKKIQCGVYFVHGNTVDEINATLLGGKPEREERFCVLSQLLFLQVLLPRTVAEFLVLGTPKIKMPQHSLLALAKEARFLRVSVSQAKRVVILS